MSERSYTFDEQMLINNLKSKLPHICYYCGKEISKKEVVTVDHKTPISRGGTTTEDNLVIACTDCNFEKDNMTEDEYNTYKIKQLEMQNNFEVNNVINELINFQETIINRIKQVKKELQETENELCFLKEQLMYNNFNASEGYLYARKMKELLNKRNELNMIKEHYEYLHPSLGNFKKQTTDIAHKVSEEYIKKSKQLAKKQVMTIDLTIPKKENKLIELIKNVANI